MQVFSQASQQTNMKESKPTFKQLSMQVNYQTFKQTIK